MRRFALQRLYFAAPTHALPRLVSTLPRPSLALLPPGSLLLRALPYPARQAISSSLCGVQPRSCPSCFNCLMCRFRKNSIPCRAKALLDRAQTLLCRNLPEKRPAHACAVQPQFAPAHIPFVFIGVTHLALMHFLLLSMCVQGASGLSSRTSSSAKSDWYLSGMLSICRCKLVDCVV